MTNREIPIFYACDDSFVKYAIVSINSMIENASNERKYHIFVLNTEISEQMQKKLLELKTVNFEITLVNVSDMLKSVNKKLPLRHYYSKTTYYRFFISEMFLEYDKAIYIDSDTIVKSDIAKLYDTEIGDCYLAAAHEQVMIQYDIYGTYCEKVVGIDRYRFFNAGLMLLNCDLFRKRKILSKFISHLSEYNFIVTQDEDYLNLICKDRVFYLDQRWNSQTAVTLPYPIEEANIIHYVMARKPWHYEDCEYAEFFWAYAKKSSVYEELKKELDEYTDEEKERDRISCDNLMKMAKDEIERPDNYLNMINETKRNRQRVLVSKKIEEKEIAGDFSTDVEDDPPTRELLPGEVDYLRKKLSSKIKTAYSHFLAKRFLRKIIKNGDLVIKKIEGLENLKALETGAIITANHFNPFDTFALHKAYMESGHKKRKLYRVVREGNYTSFPGFYGYLMRNFYTLPLAKNKKVLHEFMESADTVLKNGDFILIYPEQSMWWNYRKPKPLQIGAFTLAAKSGAPVLPCFITMADTDKIGADGFPIQEYTIHISKPVYPKKDLSARENAEYLSNENAKIWKEIYEREYDMPLIYKTLENSSFSKNS